MSPNGIVHDFQECKEWSLDSNDEASWVAFYQRLWPDMLKAIRIDKNCVWQKWGVDRMVLLPGGRQVLIDEKKRSKDYGDALLEEWSVGHVRHGESVGQKIGWALDEEKRCDFIAYAIPSTGKCFLLPFELLRQAVKHGIDQWRLNPDWYPKDAHSGSWITRNIAVPWDVVWEGLFKEMQRSFGSNRELPAPVGDHHMPTYQWNRP